ncbi:hypothetical protein BDW02DRAFT_227172 [Decorospora gaudefroyi]|uniref:Uncharacterized protein n=1 Tax=Decorospora gaudefroyi TaxID=184978 RepID=A0A6A5K500_9PLEO|nr:hypothetical protein BDW02DRAFT_227172 [Decorospora gaudefroyi]
MPISVVSALLSVAFRMIEDRTKAFMEKKVKLHESCPEDLKAHFKAHGVLGALHSAFQQHETDIRSRTKLISVKMQAALAQLGLDQFFAPTTAKLLDYRAKKRQLDTKFLDELKAVSDIVPFGTPLRAENNQVLDVAVQPALYAHAWYEGTGAWSCGSTRAWLPLTTSSAPDVTPFAIG